MTAPGPPAGSAKRSSARRLQSENLHHVCGRYQDQAAASRTWRHVADQLRARFPRLAGLLDNAEADVLAFMAFPRAHWPKLHSTNPIERLDKEVKRRADVVGIFPNEASIRRLVGAILLEQNDEWQLQHRYMSLETMAGLADEAAPPPKIAA